MSAPLPFVSVIMPCREERRHIAATLESVLATDYPQDRLEILVVDGMSTDGTREIVAAFCRRHPFIRLLDNPRRIAPAALNLGLAQARGEIILRMDVHSVYPPHYISRLVNWLEKSGADNVGGVLRTVPAADTPMARAIALAMAHPFGVGNSYCRIGAREPRWVDTVPFGCFRREVFARCGRFDETLVRSQDDEFNLRLRKHGGKILLVPDVEIRYVARETLAQVWRMFYQYGYFKVAVAEKLGGGLSLRQFIPALFVLALILTLIPGLWYAPLGWAGLFVSGLYGVTDLVCAWRAARGSLPLALRLALVFPVMHLSYGLGFLKGVVDFLLLRKSQAAPREGIPLSR